MKLTCSVIIINLNGLQTCSLHFNSLLSGKTGEIFDVPYLREVPLFILISQQSLILD
mgnify:CR=1 FL=1